MISCKSLSSNNYGDFILKNRSEKVIEFVWVTPEGERWPTVSSVDIGEEGMYELKSLKPGKYDIAIDFKNEYEQGKYNSKMDKSKCLTIEKGITKIWIVNEQGDIIRN